MSEVVVAGGGLAGLVAARHLADDHAVTLFESRETVGGRVRTAHEDGFTFDRGFQVLFTAYPALATELDLDSLLLRPFSPGATLARPGERTTLADPAGDISAAVETLFNRDVTLLDKLRVLQLRRSLLRKSPADILESDDVGIETYLAEQGFSQRFRERFAAPFYGGITLDRSLSASSIVFEYTFRMLAQGTAAVPAEGMGAVPAQLAASARELGVEIRTGTPVEAVTPDGNEVVVETPRETVRADGTIVATDPPTARSLTGCERIPTAGRGCVTQYVSVPDTHPLATQRRLVLNVEDDRPNQVAPMSAVAPAYAPDGRTLVSATFLGLPDASDEELAEEVREVLASWYPECSVEPFEHLRTERIPFAQFEQPPGFRQSLPAVTDPPGRIFLAGDYTEWSSIQGALTSGKRAAAATDGML